MQDDILAQAEKLCRKPSGYEIECKDGMYILHPDTYDILAKRANLLTELLAEAKKWKAKAIESLAHDIVFRAVIQQLEFILDEAKKGRRMHKERGVSAMSPEEARYFKRASTPSWEDLNRPFTR